MEQVIFNYGKDVPLFGLEEVWLGEYVASQQAGRSIQARFRHFNPNGQIAITNIALVHRANGLARSYPFEKRALSTIPDSDSRLSYLGAETTGNTREFTAEEDGQLAPTQEEYNFDAKVFAATIGAQRWVWNGRELGLYQGELVESVFAEVIKVSALAGNNDGSVWAVCSIRGQTGNQTDQWLRRLAFIVEGQLQIVAETRIVSDLKFETGNIMRSMADEGVIIFGRYKTDDHVVRIGPNGNILAVSERFQANNVLDLGVNPYTGDVVVTQAHNGREVQLVTLNPSLSTTSVISFDDERFDGAFEQLWSADISAPADGQNLWISGQRKEPVPPNGNLEDRGAIGFINPNIPDGLTELG